ncbi:MAG TPA: hypothetical protein VK993_10855 [Chthoniobacterales bacterium]|nr:hypothetical protein [Chthoniobacterales bacterium]
MDSTEQEVARRWMEQWRYAAKMLDEMKTRELREMTEEEARRKAEIVMEAVPHRREDVPQTSGLVEQQRWFRKARGC